MNPQQTQYPTQTASPYIPQPAKKTPSKALIWSAIGVFILIFAVLVTYQSQQTRIERLNKEVKSLKAEVKALGGESSGAVNPVGEDLPVVGGVNQKARNSKRQADLAALQTQLEIFYQNNGYYPSRSDINNLSWVEANMKNFDTSSLTDPSNPTGSKTLTTAPTENFYSYEVKDANGNDCEADHTMCAQYDLTATYEGTVNGAATVTKSNLD